MLGIKCSKCKDKFTSEYILLSRICVYCEYKINEFYYNGDLVTKQEAIKRNQMLERLIKNGAIKCL